MGLKEITDSGQVFEIKDFKERPDFKRQWRQNLTEAQRAAVLSEINRRIDEALASPSPNWGSIMNTSIEGGKTNPLTGERGDWSGTPFEPLYNACGQSENAAGMLLGSLWKMVLIARPDAWIGYRSDPSNPTFPNKGITLDGKNYFPADR